MIRPLLTLTLLLVAFLPARTDEPAADAKEFPPELVSFEPYAKNPVFTAGGEGKWDAKIRERGWILRDEAGWHLWYTVYTGLPNATMKLGYATSPDGLAWTRHPGNPIYDEHWVEDMMIVRREADYLMFAEGVADRAHLLASQDGVRWERRGKLQILKTDGNPIEEGPYGTPTAYVTPDGAFRLFYERRDEGIWIAAPVSKDLLTWKNLQDEPVLRPGPADYDRKLVACNQIVRHDGRYYMHYHGSAGDRRWSPAIAVSPDLVNWRKYAGNPLRPVAENKSSGLLVSDGKSLRFYTMHGQVDAYFPVRP